MHLAEIKNQIYLFSFIFSVPFPRSVTLVKHLLELAFDLTPFTKKKKGKKSIFRIFFQRQSQYCVLMFQ